MSLMEINPILHAGLDWVDFLSFEIFYGFSFSNLPLCLNVHPRVATVRACRSECTLAALNVEM